MSVLRYHAAWTVLAACLMAAASYFVLDRDLNDESLRVLATILPAMMAVGSASAAWRCLTTPGWPKPEQWGALCLFLFGACVTVAGLFSLFYRLANRPDWLLTLPLSNAWTYGVIAISLAGVLGPRFFAPDMSRGVKITIAALWLAGAVSIGGLFLARPNLAHVATYLHGVLYPARPSG